MMRQLEAIYEQGLLRPLEPLALPEHQRVTLTLDYQPLGQDKDATCAFNDRCEEMLWLANESGLYAGQWVALDGSRLVAHGSELGPVSAAARAAGVDQPLLTHVPPQDELPFGGW
jgi:predicted DNA-binding antitoxin AbrB/MazE fold protein